MFQRVVQYGDGRDATATAAPNEGADPVDSDRVTRTRTRTGSSDASIAPPNAEPGERLPAPLQYRDPQRYEIVAEHGRGGLGRVFRAHDKELGRDVALKELLSRGTTGELRFFREALITARLEHPGIVPVHEAGRWPDGTPFYAMKLVAGRPLKALIEECKTLEDRLGLLPHVIAVADAIAYAHDRKIIHRDLKPSNIIVGDFGETVVIDWGLAKDISGQAPSDDPVDDGPYRTNAPGAGGDGVTVAGSVVGTPAYMSPEQARGEPVDERTDVYSIGAIIGELAKNGAPADLTAVARKCMAQVPAERYSSARGIAADLRQFANGARVHAQRYSAVRLFGLWVRRHRTRAVAVMAALVAAAITGALSLSAILTSRDRAERNRAIAEAESKHSADERLNAVQALAEMTLAKDPTEAAVLMRQLPDAPQTHLLMSRAEASGIALHTIRFSSTIFNATLLTSDERVLVLTLDRRMQLVDARSGDFEVLAERMTMPARLAVHDDRLFYSVTSDAFQLIERGLTGTPATVAELDAMPIEVAHTGAAVYWVTAEGQLFERVLAHSDNVIVASNVAQLAARGTDVIWCTNTGDMYARHDGKQRKIADCQPEIQFVASGDHLMFAESTSTLGLVGNDNQVVLTTPSARSPAPDIDFHVARSGLVALADAGEQGIYIRPGTTTGVSLASWFASAPTATAAGGTVVAWGFADGTILALDTSTAQQWVYQAHDSRVDGILVTDSSMALTFANSTLRVWPRPSQTATLLAKTPGNVFNADFDKRLRRAVLDSSRGNAVMVSFAPSGATTVSLHQHEGMAFSAAWCGKLACTGGLDATVRCSDPDSGAHKTLQARGAVRWITSGDETCYFGVATGGVFSLESNTPLYSHRSEPTRIAYNAQHSLLSSIDMAGTLITFDVRDNKVVAEHANAHAAPVPSIQWEGDSIWTAGIDGRVRHWSRDLVMSESYQMRGPAPMLEVSFTHLAAVHSSSIVWIRDRRSTAEYELDFQTPIASIKLSSDSSRLAVATHSGEVHVLEPATARSLGAFRTGSDARSLAFVGDGVVAIGLDGTVFNLPPLSVADSSNEKPQSRPNGE